MTYFNKMLKLHLAKAEKIVYTNEVMLHTYKGIKMKSFKNAFTLAELLIVLGIIGIVAALTMPALIASHKEKETVTRLKKAYSTLSNAYNLAIAENSTPDNWNLIGACDPQGVENMMNKLVPYLNVTKNCGRNKGCFPNVIYKNLNNTDYYNINTNICFARIILTDGTIIASYVNSADCTTGEGSSTELQQICGTFWIDTNGFKPPNTMGKDLFSFYATKNVIVPTGTHDTTFPSFYSTCKTSNIGWGCAAWVIFNENMEYLKCNDLSWNGKNKCK